MSLECKIYLLTLLQTPPNNWVDGQTVKGIVRKKWNWDFSGLSFIFKNSKYLGVYFFAWLGREQPERAKNNSFAILFGCVRLVGVIYPLPRISLFKESYYYVMRVKVTHSVHWVRVSPTPIATDYLIEGKGLTKCRID